MTARMSQAEFIAIGARLFSESPSANDALLVLTEAQLARQSEAELLEELHKAADTFGDLVTALRLLRYERAAEACEIAGASARAAIAKAEGHR